MGLYDGAVGVVGCAPRRCALLEEESDDGDVVALEGVEERGLLVVAELIGVDSF